MSDGHSSSLTLAQQKVYYTQLRVNINHMVQRNNTVYLHLHLDLCLSSASSISFFRTCSFLSVRFSTFFRCLYLLVRMRVNLLFSLKNVHFPFHHSMEFRLLALCIHFNSIYCVIVCIGVCVCAGAFWSSFEFSSRHFFHHLHFIRLRCTSTTTEGHERAAALCAMCVSACRISMLQLECKDLWLHLKLSKIENRKIKMLMKEKNEGY